MRPWQTPSVGDEIDSRCTRCGEETIHRIVAMVEGSVHLVICTRCGAQHRHRPSPLAKKKSVPLPTERQAKVLMKLEAARTAGTRKTSREWLDFRDKTGEVSAPPYDQGSSYQEGQGLEHPVFGLGFVRRVLDGGKIEVVFEKQVKILAINRKPARPD
jgi:hypothetical protein